MIYQNLSHELRRHGKEMSPILPLRQLLRHHADVCLIDEGGALQSMAWTFVLQVTRRDAPQFVIYERKKGVERLPVSAAPANQ